MDKRWKGTTNNKMQTWRRGRGKVGELESLKAGGVVKTNKDKLKWQHVQRESKRKTSINRKFN